MQIGTLKLQNDLVLGPMAGVTDLPFRLLCKEQGCGLVYTEMVSAKAILYGNTNTIPLIHTNEAESPVGLQLFGSDPDIMGEIAAKMAEESPCSLLDINMGCPVPKIVGNGEGSALMKQPELAGKIIAAVVRACEPYGKPVTVKFRKGFEREDASAVLIAKIAEANGAAAVTVHGRTREQYYSGRADWHIIRQVKQSVSIPVIGNGDVADAESYLRMKEETGCDGVMIGRAARGNPWIFSDILSAVKGELPLMRDRETIKEMILRHAESAVAFKGEFTGIREMRKHVAWYIVGYPYAASLRDQVNQVETMEQLRELMDAWR